MMKFIQKQMNKDGFTLVELIIVIAVMAILAAVVVPRMAGITQTFSNNADERQCENYAREIELKVQLGDTVAATGEVATILGSAETPQSTDSAAFFYWYDSTNTTVHVYVAADTHTAAAAVPAGSVTEKRDNAVVINN